MTARTLIYRKRSPRLTSCLRLKQTLSQAGSKQFLWLGVLGAGVTFPLVRADAPSGRIDYGFAFLPSLSALVMHGGWGPPGWKPLSEVWKLDATGWNPLAASATPAFANHGMTWDGVNWSQVAGTQPTKTEAAGMAYDGARRQTVLLATDMATWTFDRTSWTRRTPAHSPTPAPLAFFAMEYDPVRRVCVFFGGEHYLYQVGTTYPPNTWEWDGQDWREFSEAAPQVSLEILALPPNQVALRWPTAAVGFVLYTASAASGAADWQPVQTLPSTEGDHYVTIAVAADAARYYRLQKPWK